MDKSRKSYKTPHSNKTVEAGKTGNLVVSGIQCILQLNLRQSTESSRLSQSEPNR